jgi:predicted lipid carrier protein YhbT
MEGDTELGLLVKNTLDAQELPPFDISSLSPARVLAEIKVRLLS